MRPIRIPPIENEEEYEAALARLAELLEEPESKADEAEREGLLEAIEEYEDGIHSQTPLPPKGN